MLKTFKEKIEQFAGISFLDSVYKAMTFRDLFIAAFPACLLKKVTNVRKSQQRKVEQLRQKKNAIALFFLQTPSVWKYDTLYRKLKESEYFEPLVVISPYNVHINYDKEECFRVMKQTEEFARQRGYNYVSAYD